MTKIAEEKEHRHGGVYLHTSCVMVYGDDK